MDCENVSLPILIKRIKYDLVIKLITRMDWKSLDEYILAIISSTTVSNHDLVRFITFISQIYSEL